jgi:hypothetical protein
MVRHRRASVADPKVQAALREEDEKRIRASTPRAIHALTNMIEGRSAQGSRG